MNPAPQLPISSEYSKDYVIDTYPPAQEDLSWNQRVTDYTSGILNEWIDHSLTHRLVRSNIRHKLVELGFVTGMRIGNALD